VASKGKAATTHAGGQDAERMSAVRGYVNDRVGDAFSRLVNGRVRLGILSALAVNERLSFTELKSLLATSDGNLSVHARKLEEAGYIAVEKRFKGRMPRTEYQLTGVGRASLERYLEHMEALIAATRTDSLE